MYRLKTQKVVGCEGLSIVPGSSEESLYFSVMPTDYVTTASKVPKETQLSSLKNVKKVFYLTPRDYPGYSQMMATAEGKKIIEIWWKRQDELKREPESEENFVILR